jgi:hypothetical protein
MSRILVYLGRFAVIIIGYAVAALAASAFIHLLLLGPQDWTPDEASVVVASSLIFSIPLVALFVAYFAFLPSLVAILLAEILSRRDWLFYALAGVAIGAAVLGMRWLVSEPSLGGLGEEPAGLDPALRNPSFFLLAVAAGIVGGLAYWLVAGRFAGYWRTKARPPGVT